MNKSKIISELEMEQMNKELPEFSPGDTIVVNVRVQEGNRKRFQAFEGVVIAKRNRLKFSFYCSEDFTWHRCRKNLSNFQSTYRKCKSQKARRC